MRTLYWPRYDCISRSVERTIADEQVPRHRHGFRRAMPWLPAAGTSYAPSGSSSSAITIASSRPLAAG